MADDLLTGHGLVLFNNSTQGTGIQIAGWPNQAMTGASGGVITTDSITIMDKDVTIPVVATDDFRVLYTFGKDFGQLSANGTIYLGCTAASDFKSTAASAVAEATKAFEVLRVSTAKKPADVSLAGGNGGKWQVAFNEFRFTGSDPSRQAISYSLIGLIIPTKK